MYNLCIYIMSLGEKKLCLGHVAQVFSMVFLRCKIKCCNVLFILGHHEGGPDGMDFDTQGNLLVAHWGSGYIDVSTVIL